MIVVSDDVASLMASAVCVPWHGSAASTTVPMLLVPAASAGSDASETGCVVCQNVPLTGCVTALPSTLSALDAVTLAPRLLPAASTISWKKGLAAVFAAVVGLTSHAVPHCACETGCVDCQKVPVTGNVPPAPVTSQAVVFAVLPGWTVHVPDWLALHGALPCCTVQVPLWPTFHAPDCVTAKLPPFALTTHG